MVQLSRCRTRPGTFSRLKKTKSRNSRVRTRGERVIPAWTDIIITHASPFHFFFCDPATISVDLPIAKSRFNLKTGGCCRSPNESEHYIETTKRLARPVQADMAEEPIFDGVPSGASWRVMSRKRVTFNPKASHSFSCKSIFQARRLYPLHPPPWANQQPVCSRIGRTTVVLPPVHQTVHGEFGCISRCSNGHVPNVLGDIVNPEPLYISRNLRKMHLRPQWPACAMSFPLAGSFRLALSFWCLCL